MNVLPLKALQSAGVFRGKYAKDAKKKIVAVFGDAVVSC